MAIDPAEKIQGEGLLKIQFYTLSSDQRFNVLSPCDETYNCIAWAMNCTDRWVDFVEDYGHWWPDGVARNQEPSSLIDAFLAVGFMESQSNEIEDGFDKVVLYKSRGTVPRWTHASRIVSNELEHSKFGSQWDGVHSRNIFQGTSYGLPYAIMKWPSGSTLPPLVEEITITEPDW